MGCVDVRGKTVFITGAARGIGAEAARRLHAKGANVALVGLELDRLRQRAAELGSRVEVFEADVTDSDALDAAVGGTVATFGGIDIAVANAGVSFVGALKDQTVESWVRTIDVNLTGVYRTDRAVLPALIDREGYLLNIASLAAVAHAPLMSAYTASKAGVEAMTHALRGELTGTGTVAATAYFGFVDTDLVRGAFEHPSAQVVNRFQPAWIKRPIPLSRAIDAIERGIERRSAKVYAPRWVGPMLVVRGMLHPLATLTTARQAGALEEAIRLAHPDNAAGAPPIDPILGVAVQDGVPAGEHGSAADLV